MVLIISVMALVISMLDKVMVVLKKNGDWRFGVWRNDGCCYLYCSCMVCMYLMI